MELTDLEICKRIAEIEGYFIECALPHAVIIHNGGDGNNYDPLTDDSLCFKLMVKYEVNINRYYDCATIDSDYTDRPPVANESFSTDDTSINKAICLAIIEAHKDQS